MAKQKRRKKRCANCKILEAENHKLKLQLKELQDKYYGRKKNKQKAGDLNRRPKKKGPPYGHPVWRRPVPERIDDLEEVIPDTCDRCGSNESEPTEIKPEEHIQEDIILPRVKVTKFRKHIKKCTKCGKLVRGKGKGEMKGCPIGPTGKAVANKLRYGIGIPQHKVRQIMKELFNLPFVQGSVVNFEKQLRERGGQDIYNQIKNNLVAAPFKYLDETGRKLGAEPYWLWCGCTKRVVYYHLNQSHGGKVIKDILGKEFTGVILSDFLSVYNALEGKKQKCIPHALRITERLEIFHGEDKAVAKFTERLTKVLKEIMELHRQKKRIKGYLLRRADLVARWKKFLSKSLLHQKAEKWRKKLQKHKEEITRCLFDRRVDSNNNFVERMLRPPVIMRKITFGNRSIKGINNHQVIMSLLHTARLNNFDVKKLFFALLTDATIDLKDIINRRTKNLTYIDDIFYPP